MKRITIVRDEENEWEAVYEDGLQLGQAQYFYLNEGLDLLNVNYEYVKAVLNDSGRFPERLAEVKTLKSKKRDDLLARAAGLRNEAGHLEQQAAKL